jgi:hypothetical protein
MQSKVQRYEHLIKTMQLPADKKMFSQPNVRWFLRNGAIQNTTHRNFDAVMKLARELA